MKRGAEIVDGGNSASSGSGSGNAKRKRSFHTHMKQRNQDLYRIGNGNKNRSDANGPVVKTLADDRETDSHRLAQRQKQIDYGKNTIGYDRYCAEVPRHQRRSGEEPMTPDKTMSVGKKVFDRLVRTWRQALHKYDPPELIDAAKVAATNDMGVPVASFITDSQIELKGTTDEATTTPPSRSIYETFDEDDSGGEYDSDDNLL